MVTEVRRSGERKGVRGEEVERRSGERKGKRGRGGEGENGGEVGVLAWAINPSEEP